MSNAALPLIFGALGGIEGGAAALQKQARAEAEEERKQGFYRLMQQYQQDNLKMQDTLSRQRTQEQWGHDKETTADQREYLEGQANIKRGQDLSDQARERTEKKEDIEWKAKLDQRYKDDTGEVGKTYRDALKIFGGDESKARAFVEDKYGQKAGPTGQLYSDLTGIYGEDKAKEMLNESLGAKKKVGLTEDQKFDLLSSMREEYALDPDAQPKDGGFFGKDQPAVPFEEWMKTKRPEEYSAIRGGAKGIVSTQMGEEKGAAQEEKPSTQSKFKPGQVIQQNGVRFVVDDDGTPKPQSAPAKKEPEKKETPRKQEENDEPKFKPREPEKLKPQEDSGKGLIGSSLDAVKGFATRNAPGGDTAILKELKRLYPNMTEKALIAKLEAIKREEAVQKERAASWGKDFKL